MLVKKHIYELFTHHFLVWYQNCEDFPVQATLTLKYKVLVNKNYRRNSSSYGWNYSNHFYDLLSFLMNQSVFHYLIKNMQFHSLSLNISTSYECVSRITVLDMHEVQKGHLKAKTHAEIRVYKSSWFVHDPKSD